MKPRVSFMVVMTTGVGYWLGTRSPNPLPGLLLACFSTALVVAGANVLNQWFERDSDALMARTRRRPLPSGRIDPTSAYRVGVGLSVAGILMLGIFTNVLSALLAFISWASYVLVYTPMKRMTPLCTLVGAVPGALPPVIGWAAARNELGSAAWALFAILFVWQLPHFLALAVLYREDYSRAGLPMLPSVSAGAAMTGRQTVFSAFALLPISLFPSFIGLAGTSYFYGAALLGLGFAAIAAHAASLQSLQNARRLFQASVIYLPVLLVLLACDRILI